MPPFKQNRKEFKFYGPDILYFYWISNILEAYLGPSNPFGNRVWTVIQKWMESINFCMQNFSCKPHISACILRMVTGTLDHCKWGQNSGQGVNQFPSKPCSTSGFT